MHCIYCGEKNSDDAAYCKKCGKRLIRENETAVLNEETETTIPDTETAVFNEETETLRTSGKGGHLKTEKTHTGRLNDTYTLIERIGGGGLGVIYKAYHNRLRKYVAVKENRVNSSNILKDRAEADILKQIKHSCLPQVYDFLEINGHIYTVIDYIPGESLDKVIKRYGKISQEQVLKWARQLSDALSYLHSQTPPIIHSDIKPSNIMLTPEGNVCLIDFNISLARKNNIGTSTGVSGGYSPPEQYPSPNFYYYFLINRGIPEASARACMDDEIVSTIGRGADKRSDIYSLGMTLYHLLTGIKPSRNFRDNIPIDKCGIKISEGFAHILNRMMQIAPEKRYQDGAELLSAFLNIYELDSEYRAWKRRRMLKNIMAGCLFAAGVLLCVAGIFKIRNEKNISYNELIISAESAISESRYEEAADTLYQAEKLFPSYIEAYAQNALLLYQQADYEGCISYTEELLRNAPYQLSSDADESILGNIYYTLGNAYLETEDYSNAVLNLKKAIELNNKNSYFYRDYAIAEAKCGNIQAAEDALGEAESLGLSADSIFMVQGEIYYADGAYENAAESLKRAISSAEEDSLRKRAVLLCDKAYRALGDSYIDEDIALLENEISQYSDSTSALSLKERLADAYARKAQNDPAQSKEYYSLALYTFLGLYDGGYVTEQIMENIAVIYEQLDDFESAQEMLLTWIGKYPDSYAAYKRMAFLEADRQQEKENSDREYKTMKNYYDMAKELYGGRTDDSEMDMLDVMMDELRAGNWLD